MRRMLPVLLAVQGMLPASLLPVIVSAARGSLGFTAGQAAALGATVIFSAALGALAIALAGVPARWKPRAVPCLTVLCALDLASIALTGFAPLLAIRGVHGLIGGVLTGIGYAAIGRATVPDRSFGALLTMQFVIGGAGLATLPGAIAAEGAWLLFAVLAAAALAVLALVPVMPAFAIADGSEPGERRRRLRVAPLPRGRIRWGMAALFAIQAGHTAGAAFILDFGGSRGFAPGLVQAVTGGAAMAGALGAAAAATAGLRFGRRGPVVWAGVAGAASAAMLFSTAPVVYAAAAVIGSIAWAWSIPFVLGGCAASATAPGDAVWLSFVAKLGLAVGPALAGLVVADLRFDRTIILSCLLGIAGTLLFLRLERRAPAPMPIG